jgi:hypothetical protein
MTLHPILWPDIIIAVLLAEGLLWISRSALYFFSNRRKNQLIVERAQREIKLAALDSYRAMNPGRGHEPLG